MKHHIIYVPGINDHRKLGQSIIIDWWRLFGFTPHYFSVNWRDNEKFENKLARLLTKIESLSRDGYVSVVGVSAGASATINAYARTDSLTGIVCICGKINNAHTIKKETFLNNPAFERSIEVLSSSLRRLSKEKLAKILSIHPLYDNVVPIKDTIILGAKNQTVFGAGHIFGIFSGIIFGALATSRFLHSAEVGYTTKKAL